MDFQKHLENMFAMVKDQFFVFVIGGIVIQFLATLSAGLLAGPLVGGYLMLMVHWLRTGETPRFNDIFGGMKRFGELFPVFFLLVLILFGFVLFVVPGVVMTVWWMYSLFLMADRKMSLAEAMAESRAKVRQKGFFMHFAFILAIAIIPSVLIDGMAAVIPPLGILHFFLFPLQCGCQASLYLEQFGRPGLNGAAGFEKSETEGKELPGRISGDEDASSLPFTPPEEPAKDSEG